MRAKVLEISVIFLIFILNYSCDVFNNEDLPSGIAIYKTKEDYLNLVDIGMKGDEIFRTESLWNGRYNSIHKMEVRGDDTIYICRYKLPNGYVIDSDANERHDVFLNMTHKEYLKREIMNYEMGFGVAVSDDTLRKYILDKDPYTEFYRNKTKVRLFSISDSIEIKTIILSGEIDKYFERLK